MSDTSYQKLLAAELRKSQAWNRAFLRATSDVMFLIRRDGTYLECHAQKPSDLLIPPSQFLGKNVRETVPPAVADRAMLAIEQVIADGRPRTMEYQLQFDGPLRHYEARIAAVSGQEAMFLVRNVTEQKKAEELLMAREQRFRSLIENASDIITVLDQDGTIVFESPSVQRVLGYEPQELIGKKVIAFIHPEDAAEVGTIIARVTQARRLRATVEYRFRHKDGGWRVLESIGESLLDDPTVSGIVVNSRDVTDRKSAEEAALRLAAIVRFSDDAIFSVSVDGAIESWNAGAQRLYGYSAEEVKGRQVITLAPPERCAEVDELLKTVGNGGAIQRYMTVRRRKDGSEFPVCLTISPIRDSSGTLIGASTIARDITQSKQTEEKLKQYAQELQNKNQELEAALAAAREATELKSRFLANMSHEIRTPMNGVIGMTEVLLDTQLSPEQREYAGDIQSSAEALLTVINDILDISKIEAGKLEINSIPFELKQVVEEVVGMLRPCAQAKGLKIGCGISASIPGQLRGDPVRLRQILTNLAGNAVKFTETGEVRVRAELGEQTPQAATVLFSIIDTGIGIPPDQRSMLFNNFVQVDSSNKRKYGGTGLGLAISKNLANLMGGNIGFDSEPGRGSRFWFTAVFEKMPASDGMGIIGT